METSIASPAAPHSARRTWRVRAGALLGFTLAAVVAAILGARLAWLSIPLEVRDPPGPIPAGTRLVVPTGCAVPASASPAALRDHLFAEENGLRLAELFAQGTLWELPPGTALIVCGWDLNLLKIEIDGADSRIAWVPLAPFTPPDPVSSRATK